MKYWEAEVKGHIFVAPTLKALAIKLGIKPSQIEGVYYRKRLEEMIKIRKVVKEEEPQIPVFDISGNFVVSFE